MEEDEGEGNCGPVTIKDNTTSAATRAACSNLMDKWMEGGMKLGICTEEA